VTLITRTPTSPAGVDAERWSALAAHPHCRLQFVPYRTFPGAGRRGTTILDRSTAYPWFGRRAGAAAARLASAGQVDLVYGVGASVSGYADAHARAAGPRAPLVFNPQGLEEFGGSDGSYGGQRLKGVGYFPLRRTVRRTARRADAVIATDRALVPVVTAQLPVDAARVHVVPNGLDVEDGLRFVSSDAGRALRARHGIGVGALVLLSVGRLEANKGFADLARALPILPRDAPWKWVIVGEGPDRAILERTVATAGIADRVLFAGRLDDRGLHGWYDAADLFVHPTRYEGSSLVTLEAMLHKRPVLATRVGGLPDKVIPERTGWLVAPGDARQLALALQAALTRRTDWSRFGEAGHALLLERFDWRVIQAAFRVLYAELVPPAAR
jgi:glycosyltransferase involved in cell wall biosynthesis